LVRKLLKKIINSFNKKKINEDNTKYLWEKRKAELLEKVRNKKNNRPDQVYTQPRKTRKLKNNENLVVSKPKVKVAEKRPRQKLVLENKRRKEQRNKSLISVEWNSAEFHIEPSEGKTRFHDLDLSRELMHAIYDVGFKYCTTIQQEILKNTLSGKDATGRAETGTGKTAAFLITILDRLQKNNLNEERRHASPRALILAPTRELVLQITSDAKKLAKYLPVQILSVFGGIDYRKQRSLLNGNVIDIIVATPGRLLDFYKKKGLFLNKVEILVIDEADRMLDMGFIPDVRNIIRSTPPKAKRQTLFFSATLSSDINRLVSYWTKDAVHVNINPKQIAVKSVEQIVYIVTNKEKFCVLYNLLIQRKLQKVLVFTNRKDETRELEGLLKRYKINCSVISGDVEQRKRILTLNAFKEGKIPILIATDVAGRGIHIEGISHVINYTLSEDAEDYVHRIGRTGRAGAAGVSISFASEDDSFQIPSIQEYIGRKLNCVYPSHDLLKPLPKI